VDLEAEVGGFERILVEARRALNAARTSLPGLIAAGDAANIASAREEIRLLDARIRQIEESREQTREAIKAAEARDRTATDAQAYRLIKKLVADTRQEVETLADALVAFAMALKKSGAGLDSVDALMRRSGVTPDPYVLRAKFVGLVEVALHLETGGIVGVARLLDNHAQLRQSGRADLKRAAAEFQALYLRRARSALHIMREE